MSNIKRMPILERPQEKLKFFGEESLTDSELLSIIINSGTKEKSSLEIAQCAIVSNDNNLSFLINLSIEEIAKINGIGTIKAIRLKAVGELAKRILNPVSNCLQIKSRDDAVNLASKELKYSKNEKLLVILLNNQNKIIKIKTIAAGSETNINISCKKILFEAIREMAPKMILAHNHPSGDPKPSKLDIEFTNKMRYLSKLMDIELLDHIVVSENGFESI
jgi:DNA repair protein RadC